MDKVAGLGAGGGGSRVQLLSGDSQNILRTNPGPVLDGAGLLMGQITLVGGEAAAEEAVLGTGGGQMERKWGSMEAA